MPWNKPCTLVRRAMGSYTTATVACSMSPSVTPNALAESGIESSVGSGGDSYDNALAETIIGLFKTEVINPRGPWHNLEHVEFATLEWVDWFNNRRILEPIGDIPPIEFEQQYYDQQGVQAMVAGLN